MGTREPSCRARAEVETSPLSWSAPDYHKVSGEPQSLVHAF